MAVNMLYLIIEIKFDFTMGSAGAAGISGNFLLQH